MRKAYKKKEGAPKRSRDWRQKEKGGMPKGSRVCEENKRKKKKKKGRK